MAYERDERGARATQVGRLRGDGLFEGGDVGWEERDLPVEVGSVGGGSEEAGDGEGLCVEVGGDEGADCGKGAGEQLIERVGGKDCVCLV